MLVPDAICHRSIPFSRGTDDHARNLPTESGSVCLMRHLVSVCTAMARAANRKQQCKLDEAHSLYSDGQIPEKVWCRLDACVNVVFDLL